MPEYRLPNADASRAFFALDDLAKGFIEAAFFDATAGGHSDLPDEFFTPEREHDRAEGVADGTIPGTAEASDLPDDEIARVIKFLDPVRERMAGEIEAACEREGYDLERAGHDLYFTIVGAGVGFWDRKELEDGNLGERMSALCGRGEISLYADGDADSFVVRFDCLYTKSESTKATA